MQEEKKKIFKKVAFGAALVLGGLYIFRQEKKISRLEGECKNLKDLNSGLSKNIEHLAYHLGKKSEK